MSFVLSRLSRIIASRVYPGLVSERSTVSTRRNWSMDETMMAFALTTFCRPVNVMTRALTCVDLPIVSIARHRLWP